MITKVLIIEDDDLLREIYATKLSLENFIVDTASNGAEGLDKAALDPPQIILLDMLMPQMDGLGFLIAYQKIPHPPVTILVMSNKSTADDVDKSLSLGASDYLIKAHYTPDQIVAKLRSYT